MDILPPPADPPSPCSGVCRLNDMTGLCNGCGRTLAEIAAWPTFSAEARRAVMHRLRSRGDATR